MSWWKKVFGSNTASPTNAGAPAAAVPASDAPRYPVDVQIIPGALSARVYVHEIRAKQGSVPCWSYVSDGLRSHQHPELVVTLRRKRDEDARAFPEEPCRLFDTIYGVAAQGHRVAVGGHSEFGARRFFEHHLLYADAQPLEGVTLPPGCLTALMINDDELRAVKQFGSARVLGRMGLAVAHFPFQTWLERGRRGLSLASTFEQSVLSKIGVRIGGSIVASLHGGRITMGVQRSLHAGWREALRTLPDTPIAFLTQRDPAANACLVWEPGQDAPTAISPPGSDGSRTCGCYVMLYGDQPASGGRLFEDGFAVELTGASWAEFRRALVEGNDLVIPATNGGNDFALTWRDSIYSLPPDGAPVAPASGPRRDSPKPRSGGPEVEALALPDELDSKVVLLMTQDELAARVDVDPLARQIKAIGEAAARLYARGEIRVAPVGLFVAVKPHRRVKIWAEGIEGPLRAEDAALLEQRTSAVAAPEVRGPIAFAYVLPRKGQDVAGPPPLPRAWKDAARIAGKTLALPDGMLGAVWPE